MAKSNGTTKLISGVAGAILCAITIASVAYAWGAKSVCNDIGAVNKKVNAHDMKIVVLETKVDNILQGINRIEKKLDQ